MKVEELVYETLESVFRFNFRVDKKFLGNVQIKKVAHLFINVVLAT